MKTLILLLLTVSCWNPSRTVRSNQTEPVERQPPFELPLDPPEDDSDRELSSQLEEVNAHWSAWSDWSACSRSCDGGTSHQLRTCQGGPCKGEHVRYKICNMQAFVALACLALASGSVVVPSANILQGPSSRTTLVGPEGSVISSVAPGGQVITDSAPGVSAYSAPVVAAAPLAYSAPVVSAYSAPVVSAYSAPVVSAYSAPVLAGGVVGERTVVAGPSGTIATGRTLAAPLAAGLYY